MDTSTLLGIGALVLGALVLLGELHTLTVYLLVLAVGLFAAGGALLGGVGVEASVWILAIVLALGLPLAHWARGRLRNRASEAVSQNDVGHVALVVAHTGPGLRVSYRGSTWTARQANGLADDLAPGAHCAIVRREGNTLIVAPATAGAEPAIQGEHA